MTLQEARITEQLRSGPGSWKTRINIGRRRPDARLGTGWGKRDIRLIILA